jgi:hypothetical protein
LAIPFCAGEPHARGDCSINGIKRRRVAIAIGFSPAKTDSDTDTDCDLRKISGEKFAKKPNAN